jgi:hypothetical protein
MAARTPLKFQYSFQFRLYLVFIEKMVQQSIAFHTVAPNSLKPSSRMVRNPYSWRALQRYQELISMKCSGLGDLQLDKSKQITLLHR